MGLLMACYGGLYGMLFGLTTSTDHPSRRYGLKSQTNTAPPNSSLQDGHSRYLQARANAVLVCFWVPYVGL